jgi:hypothetical protein
MVETFVTGFTTPFRARTGYGADMPQGKYFTDDLFPLITTYTTAHDAWKVKAKRNPDDIKALKNAEAALLPVFYKIVKMITENQLVTDSDLNDLGFPPRPTGESTPAPVAKTVPDAEAKLLPGNMIEIHYKGDGMPRGGKPPGQHGAEILSAVFDKRHDVTRSELTTSTFDTKSPYPFEFSDEDTGKFFYFCLRWENSRGEKGPWSKIQMVNIP